MSKPSEFGQSLLIFAALIGVCIWIGMVVASRGEERLSAACRPIEFSTDLLHEVATALSGQQPTWTLYTQQYLMGGCYYFFSVVLGSFTSSGPNELTTPGSGLTLE